MGSPGGVAEGTRGKEKDETVAMDVGDVGLQRRVQVQRFWRRWRHSGQPPLAHHQAILTPRLAAQVLVAVLDPALAPQPLLLASTTTRKRDACSQSGAPATAVVEVVA